MVAEHKKARHWSLSKSMKRDLEHVGLPARKDIITPPTSSRRISDTRAMHHTDKTSYDFDKIKENETTIHKKRANTYLGSSSGSLLDNEELGATRRKAQTVDLQQQGQKKQVSTRNFLKTHTITVVMAKLNSIQFLSFSVSRFPKV